MTNVLTDGAGHVFVLPQEAGLPQGRAIDAFEDSGIYPGFLSLEETILTEGPPPHVTGTHVFAVVEDQLGIPFVVRYRTIKP